MASTQEHLASSYRELGPSIPEDEWSAEVVSVTEVLLNKTLNQFPWYRYQQQRIVDHFGGYKGLFTEALGYVLAFVRNKPNHPWKALVPAAREIARDLRAMFDNELFTTSLDGLPVETVVSPLLNNVEPFDDTRLEPFLALAPDERGRELIKDVAYGTPLAVAARNQGITPQTAHERWKRFTNKAREEFP